MSRTRLKLAAALAGLVAAVVLATAGIAVRSLRARETAQLAQSLAAEGRLIGALVESAGGIRPDSEELSQLVQRAGARASGRVTLIDRDGRVVADSELAFESLVHVTNHGQRGEVLAAFEGQLGVESRLSRTLGRPFLYVAVPGPDLGVVRVAMDLGAVEAQMAALRNEVLVAGAIGIVIALVLAYLASGMVLAPVRKLGQVASSFQPPSRLGRLAGRDEIGELAVTLEAMGEELRQRLREVSDEKERLHAVLNGMVEGVLVLDAAGRVVLANPRLRELFGAWGAVEGRSALEVIRRPDVEEGLAEAARDGAPVVRELTLSDGKRFLQMHAVRFPATGTLQGTAAVFHDLTEVRRLESVRQEFVANVSHELKTPLTAIRGFAETLRSPLDDEQREQYLDVILRHAERLTSLIDDLLELSRIEGRKEKVQTVELSVGDVAGALLRDMKPRLEALGLRAELVRVGPDRALADRRALEQVLLNLLDNAAKYSDAGSRVGVRIGADAQWVRLDVSDDGMGIPEADQARIFERFYRVDKARSRDLGGTGLGLAIVKHLTQAMGGEVSLESREGEGSTFTVRLPRA